MIAQVDITGVRLETDRLILRPWTWDDLEDFFEYASIEGLGQMAGWLPHKSIADSKAILDMSSAAKRPSPSNSGKPARSSAPLASRSRTRIPSRKCWAGRSATSSTGITGAGN